MKFFLSQMETSKESLLVGTLTLMKAIVSADGECRLECWLAWVLSQLLS